MPINLVHFAHALCDDAFDLVGVVEPSYPEAAKGLPGPHTVKRNACHVWKPQNVPRDDPRHCWTRDDCWKDVVALVSSEGAVREYILERPELKPKRAVGRWSRGAAATERRSATSDTEEDALTAVR